MKIVHVLFFFVLGAVIGSVYDGFHTFSGTTYYANPVFMKAAWWVPLIFGGAGVGIAFNTFVLQKIAPAPLPQLPKKNIALLMLSFGFIYFFSGFFPAPHNVKLTCMAVFILSCWYLWNRIPLDLIGSIPVALIGTAVEMILTHYGHFYYTVPQIFGVPYWLPFLYIMATVSLAPLYRRMASH